MSAQLILPDPAYENSYKAYIAELGDEERYPWLLALDHADFPALVKRLANFALGIDLPEGFVPSSTFWLVQDGELAGVSNLRHYLNERISHVGGHIGLGLRPSYRGRGLGKLLLRLTMEEARKRGIGDIQVHCHRSNEPSARMIMANGGVLHSEVREDGVNVVQRYVIGRWHGQNGLALQSG